MTIRFTERPDPSKYETIRDEEGFPTGEYRHRETGRLVVYWPPEQD